MANTFKRYTQRNVGTSVVSVGSYTVPAATQTTVIGLSVANLTANTVKATVIHHDGSNSTNIVKAAQVLPGTSLVIVGGDQKLVLQTGDSVRVSSDTETSLDVVMSILEIS
jgi:hypothetical protein